MAHRLIGLTTFLGGMAKFYSTQVDAKFHTYDENTILDVKVRSPIFSSIPKGDNQATPLVKKIKLGWAGSANKSFVGMLIQDQQHLVTPFYWEIFSNYYCRWWFVLAIFLLENLIQIFL